MMYRITRDDFKQEGEHHWILNHRQYRVAISKYDGSIDINIHAKLTNDPTIDEWETALKTVNTFYNELRIAERYEKD